MICPKCNNTLPDQARFCNNCGGDLQQPTSKQSNAAKQVKTRVEYRGRAVRKAAKTLAAFAVAGGTVALLWTPFIQPVLLSKTIGPQDNTAYQAKLDYKKSKVNSSDFPNGKWVREDGKAVLYIAHMEEGDEFQFELYASPQGEQKPCELLADATVDQEFEPNNEVQAIAHHTAIEADQPNKVLLNFAALNKEEAIRITSEQSWVDSRTGEALPDGTYYRIKKTWFWLNEEGGKLSMVFTPDAPPQPVKQPPPAKEKEDPPSLPPQSPLPPKDVIRVAPPPVPQDGKTPKRVSGGGEYLSAELMEILYIQGFFVDFEGAYYIKKADVRDFSKYFDYHYYNSTSPFKQLCSGVQEGTRMMEAQYESMQKIEDSLYGKTRWSFAYNVDFLPEFSYMWLEQSGEFITPITVTSGTYEVGYQTNELEWESDVENSYHDTHWDPNIPHVINVTGGWDAGDLVPDALIESIEYDLNLYFYDDGTAEGEGFMTINCKGTQYITYWVQLCGVEFSVDLEYQELFNFTATEYQYSFETLDEDVPEYTFERETGYVAIGDQYNYRKYEYETGYQVVE